MQSQTKNGVQKRPQVWHKKFIEKTETVQEASTEKNTIYREALILLKELRSVSDKLRIIFYTMKSLILAQDER